MMHASEGQLLAYLDDELAAAQRSETAAHLSNCVECGTELKHLESISAEFHDAVSWLEVEVPLERAHQRFDEARREREAAAVVPMRPRRFVGRVMRIGLLKAAALGALLAGAASAAIPDSPVRDWIEDAFGIGEVEPVETPTVEPVQTPVEPPPAASSAQEPIPQAVMALEPIRNRIQVRLSDVRGRVIVRYVDEQMAAIRVANPNLPGFTAEGVMGIRQVGTADVYVDIPIGLENARVEVNGQLYLEKRDGGTVTYAATEQSSATLYSFPARN